MSKILDRLNAMDTESIETEVTLEVLDFESMVEVAESEETVVEAAEEVEEAVEVFTEAAEIIEEIQDEVEEVLENIEEMSPVAVGKALGAIAEKASELIDVAETAVDAEAMNADYKAGAKVELEAISESIKKAWLAVKNFFKTVWIKIKKLISDVVLWAVNGTKKLNSVRAQLAKKSNDLVEGKDGKAFREYEVTKLATLSFLSGTSADSYGKMKDSSGATLDLNKQSALDKDVEKAIKKDPTAFTNTVALDSNDIIKVTRCDGKSLSYVIATKDGGALGFKKYVKASLSEKSFKVLLDAAMKDDKFDLTKDEINKLLNTAAGIIAEIKPASAKLFKDMADVDAIVSGDIEKYKADAAGLWKMTFSRSKVTGAELTASERLTIVRNRASFTSRVTYDVLFGLNSISNDMIAIASKAVTFYQDEKK